MKTNKSDIQEVMEQIVSFTQERDWDQFHNGKDLALALSIEASELNEAFLWKEAEKADINKIKEELADLDKEKVLKIAKKKSEEIKEKLDDLYELAKKKATPVVEGAVEDLRNSAIKVTKEVLTKLEKVEK